MKNTTKRAEQAARNLLRACGIKNVQQKHVDKLLALADPTDERQAEAEPQVGAEELFNRFHEEFPGASVHTLRRCAEIALATLPKSETRQPLSPRCPKCKSENVHRLIVSTDMSKCRGCGAEFDTPDVTDLARFFFPDPEPAKPEKAQDGWIAVSSGKLPETGKMMLLCLKDDCPDPGWLEIGMHWQGTWWNSEGPTKYEECGIVVTHWQPLPAPPAKSAEKGTAS